MADLIFKCLHLTVDNIKQSVDYYEKLGFRILDSESTNYTTSVYLCLTKDIVKPGDFTICLTMIFGKPVAALSHPPFSLEFVVGGNLEDGEGNLFQDTLSQLSDKGIEYKNISAPDLKKIVVPIGVMNDPDGNSLQLVDDYDYTD